MLHAHRERRRVVQPGRRFEEKRQARQGSSAPLQSDLAQKTCSTPPRGQTEKVGLLRGETGTSRQIQVEASQLGAHLWELGRPADFSQRLLRFPRHCEGSNTPTGRGRTSKNCGWVCGTRALQTHQHSSATRSYSQMCHKAEDGVTAEIFQLLSSLRLAQLAQSTTDMFTSLDFETVDYSCSEPDPRKAFSYQIFGIQPISSLSTMIKLLGNVWLAAMRDTQFNSFQAVFLHKTDATHGVFVLESLRRSG